MRFAQIAWKFEGLQFCHQFFWNRLSHLWDIGKNVSEDYYFLDSNNVTQIIRSMSKIIASNFLENGTKKNFILHNRKSCGEFSSFWPPFSILLPFQTNKDWTTSKFPSEWSFAELSNSYDFFIVWIWNHNKYVYCIVANVMHM